MGTTPRGSEATIYDVAKAAGVSPSTVSRAFSRPGRVSATTAERIRAVAESLGYRGREVTSSTPTTHSRMLGLAVADITNPFNYRVMRGCEAAAAEGGYIVTVTDAQESHQLEREMLERSLPLLDGLVIASSRMSDVELRTIARNIPTVVLNRKVSGIHCILPDMAGGARKAVEHLAGLGHVSIAYVAGPEASWADGARWGAIRDTARSLGITEHRLGPFAPTIHGGRAAAEVVAARRLRAVICYNDLMALGLIKGLVAHGLTVPDHVSVIGFDNIFAGAMVEPGLTTVAAPLTMMGDSAVRAVTAMLSGGSVPAGPVVLPVRFVPRGTTARAR